MRMSFRRRGTFRRTNVSNRRKKVWARQDAHLAVAPFTFDLLNNYRVTRGILQNDPGTTERAIRLSLSAQFAAATNYTQDTRITVGIYKDTLTRPVAQVSDPITDIQSDWLYWEVLYPTETNHLAPADADRIFSWRRDIRSMRRLDESAETLWLVVSSGGSAGPALSAVNCVTSTLLLLP
jgi:hypothetical protein